MCGFYASALLIGSEPASPSTPQRPVTSQRGRGSCSAAVATVFIAVAVYVAAVVIANGVDTVIAGRLRQIAVLRLLGADARSLRGRDRAWRHRRRRWSVSVVGVLVGALVGDVARSVLVSRGSLPRGGLRAGCRSLAVPAALVITAGGGGGRRGSGRGRCCAPRPAQALLGASVPAPETRRRRPAPAARDGRADRLRRARARCSRPRSARAAGPPASCAAALGAMLSGTGLLVGARLVVPALVAAASRLLGRDPPEQGGGPQRGPGARPHHPLDDGAGHRGDAGDDVRGRASRRCAPRRDSWDLTPAPGRADRRDAALHLGDHDLHRGGRPRRSPRSAS